MAIKKTTTARRKARVRRAVKFVANGRPRLSIFRSSQHIYAQVIDDLKGHTVPLPRASTRICASG
jgi:large subunit ribosomal protein L18